MNKPLISVITVCYNSGDVIERTILSVIQQSYSNIEYIIIDGGSKDSTLKIINKYSDKISILISEPDNGVYYAMNKGISHANGEWINFMNAGDIFASEDVIEKCFHNKIYDIKIGVILGDTICSFPWADYIKKGINTEGNVSICHQSVFTRTSILKTDLYDTKYKIIADNVWFKKHLNIDTIYEYIPINISVYEGYNGISAKNSIKFYKELSISNNTPINFRWKLSVLKLRLKLWIQSFIPVSIRNKKWERKLDNTLIRICKNESISNSTNI